LNDDTQDKLIDWLSSFVTDERLAKMHRVLAQRTRWIQVLLEDIYQPHNASAVLRSCDAMGLQNVHVVEKKNKYKPHDDIALGTAQWLTLRSWQGEQGIVEACREFKRKGLRVVATTPHTRANVLEDLPVDKPMVLMFGTELTGLSELAMNEADEFVYIPMQGFVESFNISVSVALSLYSLSRRLRLSTCGWQLGETEKREIMLAWLRGSQKASQALERRFFEENPYL